jgi:hypothetical protein
MLVQWKQIEEVLQKDQFRHAQVCPVCQERYEPCIAVGIVGVYVIHLRPCTLMNGYMKYPVSFCGQENLYMMFRRIVFSQCANWRFLATLAQRYPMLLHAQLTERALREAGCDIEAEWALWQMGRK